MQNDDEELVFMYNAYLHKLLTSFLSQPVGRNKASLRPNAERPILYQTICWNAERMAMLKLGIGELEHEPCGVRFCHHLKFLVLNFFPNSGSQISHQICWVSFGNV
jgi:hypothetical protein